MPHKYAIRSLLRAEKDHCLLSFDLSQAESWIVAFRANDPNMKEALSRGDIHSLTGLMVNDMPIPIGLDPISYSLIAKTILTEDQRYIGKKCNHSFNYKQSAEGATAAINAEGRITVTHKQTKKWRATYLATYRIKPWWDYVEDKLRTTRTLTNGYGFTRTFHSPIGEELYREGIAFDPQSTIADHMYGATHKELGIEGGLKSVVAKIIKPSRGRLRLIQSAHDSGIIEYPNTMDVVELALRVKEFIQRPLIINGEMFTIPMDAKWSERWMEDEHKINLN